jgi:ureidoglycolate lyase
MAHRAAPKLAERVGQHEIKIVAATEETLRGYGRIERDFPSAKIEIVRWPAQGWRPVDADTGDQGGTTEGIFHFFWKGEVLYGQNDAVGDSYLIGWSRDPSEASETTATPDRSRVLVWHANYHPDGGQLFFPRQKIPYIVPLACRATTSRRRSSSVSIATAASVSISIRGSGTRRPCRWRRRPSSTTARGACMRG